MKKDEMLSELSLAIMGLIAQAPQSGYQLKTTFSNTPMGHFSSSPGAIYPALKRLEQSRWIRPKGEKSDTRRPRRIYALTSSGRAVLKRNLIRPVTRQDIMRGMDELMLRFAFIGHILGTQSTIAFLRNCRQVVQEYLPELQEYFDKAASSMPLTGRLAMQNGIAGYRAYLAWADDAIRQLKAKLETKEED